MQKIILTGATGGLGRCLVDVIGRHDISELICVYRSEEKFASLWEKYKGLFGYLLTEEDDFKKLFDLVCCKDLDNLVLVLNAFSIFPIKKIGDMTAQELEDSVYGNVTRNYLLLNEAVRYCKDNELGLKIINLDSGAADHPLMGWGNYCASKAFMNSLLSVVACENPDYQIVSVDPGVMDTDMQAKIRATGQDVFEQVDTFINYKESGMLKAPEAVAEEIANRYIYDWTAKSMREKLR